jgi:hypothetical protein
VPSRRCLAFTELRYVRWAENTFNCGHFDDGQIPCVWGSTKRVRGLGQSSLYGVSLISVLTYLLTYSMEQSPS